MRNLSPRDLDVEALEINTKYDRDRNPHAPFMISLKGTLFTSERVAVASAEHKIESKSFCEFSWEEMGIELESGKVEEDGWVRGAIIGAGASGTVSLAMSRGNGQLFAVKSAASSSGALDNEYRILQSLDSPYIVACLGHCYSVENCVKVQNLFMEYMPGGSIGDLLIKFGGQLDESVIRAYTRGILRGMDYLHRQGIVHCDIKAKNVLVGANGVKLADFGSAKRISDENNGPTFLFATKHLHLVTI